LSYTPAPRIRKVGKSFAHVNGQLEEQERFGQQTPRRWGWGTPLKKRTATRITTKLKLSKILSTSYLGLSTLHHRASETQFQAARPAE